MDDKIGLFGRSYSQLGNGSSDIILKTKGLVKIQWGNKFIDLIKDGKINVDSEFIFREDEVGEKDGIYITGDENNPEIWVVCDGIPINIKGEIGNTYVSFLGEQETTSDLKYQALTNIGFIYKDITSIKEDSLKNGVVYIESELKLYTVINGELNEFTVLFPNPFKEQFIIEKSDDKKGSLVIKGTGDKNSITFDNLVIYNESDTSILNAIDKLLFFINGNDKLTITSNEINSSVNIVSSMFMSPNATPSTGFRLYTISGKSVLEVDELIVRNGSKDNLFELYPEYWLLDNNIITSIEESEGNNIYDISFRYPNTYEKGDKLVTYYKKEELEDGDKEAFAKVIFIVEAVSEDSINVLLDSENIEDISVLVNNVIFCTSKRPIKIDSNSLDIVNTDENVKSRYGHIRDLYPVIKDNVNPSPIIESGFLTRDWGIFRNAAYDSVYELPDDDDSSRFASTEWVKRNTGVDIWFEDDYRDLTIPEYFSRPEILALVNKQEIGTAKTYVGYNGFITVFKGSRDHYYRGIIATMLPDNGGLFTHRTINGVWDDLLKVWYRTSTYLIQDFFLAGYYKSKDVNSLDPVEPEYLGTDVGNFVVNPEYKYLFRTIDGKKWQLVDLYVEENLSNRVYIVSSDCARFLSGNSEYAVPTGFIGYCDSNGISIDGPRGSSGWISLDTNTSTMTEVKNYNGWNIYGSLAKAGAIPTLDGYAYRFWINDSDFNSASINNPQNWHSTRLPSYNVKQTWVESDFDYKQCYDPVWKIRFNDPNDYLKGGVFINKVNGTDEYPNFDVFDIATWKDKSKVSKYIQFITHDWCNVNISGYKQNTGWFYRYVKLGGMSLGNNLWSGRFANSKTPSSDDPTNSEYLSNPVVDHFNAHIQTPDCLVEFYANITFGNPVFKIEGGVAYGYVNTASGSEGKDYVAGWYNLLFNHTINEYTVKITNYKTGVINYLSADASGTVTNDITYNLTKVTTT